ncbi:hypothetical protein HDK77DRAFT_118194 [Phyllosticta capitalensis]
MRADYHRVARCLRVFAWGFQLRREVCGCAVRSRSCFSCGDTRGRSRDVGSTKRAPCSSSHQSTPVWMRATDLPATCARTILLFTSHLVAMDASRRFGSCASSFSVIGIQQAFWSSPAHASFSFVPDGFAAKIIPHARRSREMSLIVVDGRFELIVSGSFKSLWNRNVRSSRGLVDHVVGTRPDCT